MKQEDAKKLRLYDMLMIDFRGDTFIGTLVTIDDYREEVGIFTDKGYKTYDYSCVAGIAKKKPAPNKETSGTVMRPYVVVRIDGDYDTEKYDALIEEYENNHSRCPVCGTSREGARSLFGYILNMDEPDEYKDLNTTTCPVCGNTHTIHNRVSASVGEDIEKRIDGLVEILAANIKNLGPKQRRMIAITIYWQSQLETHGKGPDLSGSPGRSAPQISFNLTT